MTETASTRTSRSRRVVALMGWACLVATAFLLWNVRQSGSVRSVTMEPVAFLLAAFAAFVGVFAWMLYNPGRRSAAESPSLFFGAGATLFPPPIIGFCLMPIDSELRWWLALGLFLLCAIAILSHLPDEFFGVPRSRQTYLTPLPVFDRVAGTVLDPESSWFRFEDLSRIVPDTERPSLAPRSYLQREVARSSPATRTEIRAATAVDDILGSDFDLGLLDDAFVEDDLRDQQRPARTPTSRLVQQTADRSPQPHARQQSANFRVSGSPTADSSRPADAALQRAAGSLTGGPTVLLNDPLVGQTPYQTFNPESRYLVAHQQQRRHASRQTSLRPAVSRYNGAARVVEVTEPGSTATGSSGEPRSIAHQGRRSSSATSMSPGSRTSFVAPESDSAVRHTPRVQEDRTPRGANSGPNVSPLTTESHTSVSRPAADTSTSKSRTAHAAHTIAGAAALSSEAFHATQRQALAAGSQAFAEAEPESQKTRQLFGQPLPSHREPRDRTTGRADEEAPASVKNSSSRHSRYESAAAAATAVEPEGRLQQFSNSSSTAQDVQERAQVRDSTPTFQRTRESNGTELIEGVMPVHFDRGQKRVNVHVPFSPPLAGVPDVECESVDGEDLRLKVAVRQSYGIRIEARRSIADQPLDTEIGFAAIYVGDAQSA